MAARLPVPGSDDGSWGDVLNEYLTVSHNANGTFKSTAITSAGGASNSAVVHNTTDESIGGIKTFVVSPIVPTPSTSTQAANKTYVDTTVTGKASAGANSDITSLSGLTTPLSVAQGGTGAATLTGLVKGNGTTAMTTVTAPAGTIVGTTDTQTLTNKSISGGQITSAVATATAANGLTSATTTVSVSSATAPVTGYVLTATSSTAATWQSPTGGGMSAATYDPASIAQQVVGITATQTLTNKRVTKRVATLTNAATITPATDSFDGGFVTALAQATTFANPTGTPTSFQQYVLRIKSASAQTLTWDTQYRGSNDIPLPTSTTGSSKTDYLGFQYNVEDTKWDIVAISRGY